MMFGLPLLAVFVSPAYVVAVGLSIWKNLLRNEKGSSGPSSVAAMIHLQNLSPRYTPWIRYKRADLATRKRDAIASMFVRLACLIIKATHSFL